MRIQARKCPFTGEIFEEKDIDKYVLHLQKIREEKQDTRKYYQLKNNFLEWLRPEQENLNSFGDLVPWILKNQDKLIQHYNLLYREDHWYGKFPKNIKIDDLKLICRFDANTSNSHSNPRAGVSNWCGRAGTKPTGYPGWKGTLSGRLGIGPKQNAPAWREFFEMIDIHTGTGGGGRNFYYEVTVFVTDWPGMGQELTIKKLTTGSLI